VGGATGGLATVGVAISAKNWLWENKGKILLFILIVIAILVALWKAFTGDKGEEPEEE
jgi:Tfp pilus assembly protein PilO